MNEDEANTSYENAATGDSLNSPTTLETTPEKVNGYGPLGAVSIELHAIQNGVQASGRGSTALFSNTSSRIYAAYQAMEIPKDEVYNVTNRENLLDDPRVMSSGGRQTTNDTSTGIREIRFGKPFGKVLDIHLNAISSHSFLASNLSYLAVHDASRLSDEAIFSLAIRSNPKVIILNGAVNVTDAPFVGLCINCKGLEYVEITGAFDEDL
jgi:hypothetical protein